MGLGRRVVALLTLLACGKSEETTTTTSPVVSSSASAHPVDHLAEGELLEGTEKAFGMVLPRGVRVVHAFDDLVIAEGSPRADLVSNYFRQRVKEGKVTVGARSTVFDGVRSSAAPDLEFYLLVQPGEGASGCRIEVRKLTQPKAPAYPDDEARWRAAGLKPNGEPLDPKQLH